MDKLDESGRADVGMSADGNEVVGARGDQAKANALLAELLAKPDAAKSDTDTLLEELLNKAAETAEDSGSALDELLAKAAATVEAAGSTSNGDSDTDEILAELLGEKADAKPEKTAAEALVDELLEKHAAAAEPKSSVAEDATATATAAGADAIVRIGTADAADSHTSGADGSTGKPAIAKAAGKNAAAGTSGEPSAGKKASAASAKAAKAAKAEPASEPDNPIIDEDEAALDEADETAEADLDETEASLVADDAVAHGLQKPEPESSKLGGATVMVGQLAEPAVLPQRHHVWPLLITALIIFILATGGLTYFNRTVIAGQAEMRADIQRQGDALLDESIALIQNADSVIVALSVAVDSQITETDIPRLEALLDQMGSTQASLDQAIVKAKEAEQVYIDKDRKALAVYAQTAAELRKQMLELSSQLTEYDMAALRCALAVDYSWMLIIDAASEMHAAGEAVNTGKASAVPESRDYNQSALEKLTLAEEALVKAEEHFSDVDLKPLMDYVVTKKVSAQLALESDLAFIDGDYTTTRTKNAEFIAKDAEAVQLALALPESPMSLVQQAYSDVTEQLRADYTSVRDQAVENDAYLRDYLGVNTPLESVPDAGTPGAAPGIGDGAGGMGNNGSLDGGAGGASSSGGSGGSTGGINGAGAGGGNGGSSSTGVNGSTGSGSAGGSSGSSVGSS